MRGARILAETLEAAGVEYAFGLGGSAILGLLDEIEQSDVEFVTTRHEQVATTMATGYALATRRPTATIAHVGPGAANQVLGVAAAYRDNVPVVAISGNEPSHRLGLGVRHEWDVTGIFERFTKHNVRVTADRPGQQIRDALLRSVTGVPGPVHIDFPRDLEEADLPAPSSRWSSPAPSSAGRPARRRSPASRRRPRYRSRPRKPPAGRSPSRTHYRSGPSAGRGWLRRTITSAEPTSSSPPARDSRTSTR